MIPCKTEVSVNSIILIYQSRVVDRVDLRLTIDPLPQGEFVHYDFFKLQYVSHTMRHVSPLRVEALSCNSNITYVTL